MSINNSFILMLAIPILAAALGILTLIMSLIVDIVSDAIRE